MTNNKVALVHRAELPGATGTDDDVLKYPQESVEAVEQMIEEAFRLESLECPALRAAGG